MCARCKAIRIETAITSPCPPATRFIASLGEIDDGMRHSSCPLCRLLAAVYNPSYFRLRGANSGYHLRAFQSCHASGPMVWPRHSIGAPGVILGVCRGSKSELRVVERSRCLTRGFIAPLAPTSSTNCSAPECTFQAQEVRPRVTSFTQIKQWLDICLKTHDGACKMIRSDRSARFKCIDVNDCKHMTPGFIGPDDDYLALSYVCSEACERQCCQQGVDMAHPHSPTHVCQTIKDALVVTRSIGFRYLWVDKYCIDQHDYSEKRAAIATMDQIYEGASMTLVAAPLLGSRPGLPGISRERSSSQLTVEIGEFLWTSTLPHLSVAVASSAWATRGWTYQEMVLSTRCLFFTDEQIYFLCQNGTSSESIANPSDLILPSLGSRKFRSYALNTDFKISRQQPEGLWQFFEDLHNYKRRNLSFDTDSLGAFQGILKRSKFKHIWGVPIVYDIQTIQTAKEKDIKKGFLRGLWWENPGHHLRNPLPTGHRHTSFRRRHQFPSWSWSGWKGSISPHKLHGDSSSDDECNAISEQSPEIYLWFEAMGGSLKTLRQTIEHPTLELNHVMHIGTTTHRVRIRRPTGIHKMPHICGCCMERVQCYERHAVVQDVRLFQDPYLVEPPEMVFERHWYVIRLFTTDDQSNASNLTVATFIADWDGDREHFAEVIGAAYLDIHSLPAGTEQIVKLR